MEACVGTSPYAHTCARMVASHWDGRERCRLPGPAGRELLEARHDAGLTQAGLAARTAMVATARRRASSRENGTVVAGVSRQTVSALERGERAPSMRSARLIADALELGQQHPLRRRLQRAASRSRRRERRARQALRRNPLLRVGTRLLDRGAARFLNYLDDAEAERQRQVGERQHRGGRPSSW